MARPRSKSNCGHVGLARCRRVAVRRVVVFDAAIDRPTNGRSAQPTTDRANRVPPRPSLRRQPPLFGHHSRRVGRDKAAKTARDARQSRQRAA